MDEKLTGRRKRGRRKWKDMTQLEFINTTGSGQRAPVTGQLIRTNAMFDFSGNKLPIMARANLLTHYTRYARLILLKAQVKRRSWRQESSLFSL